MTRFSKLITAMPEQWFLVTGGAGFIGSHLVDLLIEHGKRVNVLDNLSSGRLENLTSAQKSERFTLFKGDLLNSKDVRDALEGCEVVFHLAANPEVRIGSTEPSIHFRQNVETTFRLLETIRQSNSVKGLVFASSSTVYGDADVLPTPETFAPLKPVSVYGAAKLASEGLISSYALTYGFRAVICRLANIIGPRAKIGVIRDFIQKLKQNPEVLEILGDGTQSKSYLYVRDVIECLVQSYIYTPKGVEIFNVGSADRTNVMEIAEIVSEVMGLTNVKYQCTGGIDGGRGWKGDVKQMLLDITRIRELGWEPRWTSHEAVHAAADALYREMISASD